MALRVGFRILALRRPTLLIALHELGVFAIEVLSASCAASNDEGTGAQRDAPCHCFSLRRRLYSAPMSNILGWGGRLRGLFADTKGPWGTGSGGGGDE